MGIYGNRLTFSSIDENISIDISNINNFCESTALLFDAFNNFFSITEAENITVYKSSNSDSNEEKKEEEREEIIDGEAKLVEVKKTFWNKIKELFIKVKDVIKNIFTKLADSIHNIYLKLNITDAIFKKYKETCKWEKVEEALKSGKLNKNNFAGLRFCGQDMDLEDSGLFISYNDYYYGEEGWLGIKSHISVDRKGNMVIDAKRDIEPILDMDDEKADDFYKEFEEKLAEFKKTHTDFFHSYFNAGNNNKGGQYVHFNENAFGEDGRLKENLIEDLKPDYERTLKLATEGDAEIKKYKDDSNILVKRWKLDESNLKSLFKDSKKDKSSLKAQILYNKMNWQFTAAYVSCLMTAIKVIVDMKRNQQTEAIKTILRINKIINKGGK